MRSSDSRDRAGGYDILVGGRKFRWTELGKKRFEQRESDVGVRHRTRRITDRNRVVVHKQWLLHFVGRLLLGDGFRDDRHDVGSESRIVGRSMDRYRLGKERGKNACCKSRARFRFFWFIVVDDDHQGSVATDPSRRTTNKDVETIADKLTRAADHRGDQL